MRIEGLLHWNGVAAATVSVEGVPYIYAARLVSIGSEAARSCPVHNPCADRGDIRHDLLSEKIRLLDRMNEGCGTETEAK